MEVLGNGNRVQPFQAERMECPKEPYSIPKLTSGYLAIAHHIH